MLLGATRAWADSGLYICGEEMSSTSNWSLDVTNNISDCIKSGTISYDAASKTVTFDNINDGTLNITSGSYPIETKSSTTKLQFNGATVIAQSETMGSALWDEGGASICFGGGTFAAYGTSEPIHLSASGEFVFSEGIDFRYPVGAYIGIGNRIYNADDVKVEGNWVVIGPDNEATQDLITGVDEIASSRQPADNGFIYNLAGQQIVNGKWSNGKLPRGIYIQNGKKIFRK